MVGVSGCYFLNVIFIVRFFFSLFNLGKGDFEVNIFVYIIWIFFRFRLIGGRILRVD